MFSGGFGFLGRERRASGNNIVLPIPPDWTSMPGFIKVGKSLENKGLPLFSTAFLPDSPVSCVDYSAHLCRIHAKNLTHIFLQLSRAQFLTSIINCVTPNRMCDRNDKFEWYDLPQDAIKRRFN